MPSSLRRRALLTSCILLGTACASVPARAPSRSGSARAQSAGAGTGTRAGAETSVESLDIPDPFPDQATLEQIAAGPTPPTTELLGEAVAPIDAWTLEGAGAAVTEVVDYRGDDPSALAMAAVLAEDTTGRRLTAGMQCVAREHGRFVLAHGDDPADDVQSFIAARCGTTVTRPAVHTMRLPIEEFPDRPLHARADRMMLTDMLEPTAPGAHVGVYQGRGEYEGVLSVAWGVPDVDLEPVPVVVEGRSQVELRGRVHWDFERLSGYVTRGELGAMPCKPVSRDPAVAPRFALRCPVSRQDDMAVIELHASKPGRLLGRCIARVIVSPSGSPPTHYQAPRLSLPIGPDEHDDVAVATGVNALRRTAGMPPVSAATGQSEVLGDLLPHFLVAIRDDDEGELADRIALGIMAGRRVEANVRWGSFFTARAPSNWSIERDLAAALLSPYSRARLMDPDATAVAYASLADPSHAMRQAVIATYSEFRERDQTDRITSIFEAIDRQRAARGLPPVARMRAPGDVRTLRGVADRVRDGVIGPEQGLHEMLGYFAKSTRHDFQGLMMFPRTFEGWEPPIAGPLLGSPSLAVALTVGHFQPEGAAWGQSVVFVVFAEL